ncbi:MAG: hypothetical protein V4696_04760 [Pseudomonadota bacterium]
MKRNPALAIGFLATLAASFVWHGPGGAGARFTTETERIMRATLDYYEMPGIAVQMQRGPLTRTLRFSGPADDFQRSEIVRIGREVPGIADTAWAGRPSPRALPLLAEVMLMALSSFAIGAIFAYIAALRRRARDAIYA